MNGKPLPIAAVEVVGAGLMPQCMQFPSPVYFARWIDARHALVGAGGGGKRFGMVNVLAIIAVDVSPKRCGNNGQIHETSPQPQRPEQPLPWCYVTAVDMEENIPWCASNFLPCVDEVQLASGVVGWIAVSHITCFTLVEVRRCPAMSEFMMRRLACVAVPSDRINPDKKPIAIVQGAVVVAHDNNGVHVYGMPSLMQQEPSVMTQMSSEGEGAGAKDAESPSVVTTATPIAVWSLSARVNDLHANRFFVPKKRRDVNNRRERLFSDYLLIAALVQDKTLRLTTMKLHQRSMVKAADRDEKESDSMECSKKLVDAGVFTGKDCRIPFSLMKSSMRLVQVLGVEDVDPSAAKELWVKTRRLHCETGVRGAMPVATLLVVVYDLNENISYMLTARVFGTSSISEPTNANKQLSKRLALKLSFASHPSPLVNEGVTSFSPCHYFKNSSCDVPISEGVGTAIPSHWLVGTVEGALVLFLYNGDGNFQALSYRPSKKKRELKEFPPLHREPVSSVAVSVLNDVLTADIAQNVVLSTLPFWEQVPMAAYSTSDGVKLCRSESKCTKRNVCLQREIAPNSSSRVNKTTTEGATVGYVAKSEEEKFLIRPKSTALSLFPPDNECNFSLCGNSRVFVICVAIVSVFALLIAVLVGYWL